MRGDFVQGEQDSTIGRYEMHITRPAVGAGKEDDLVLVN